MVHERSSLRLVPEPVPGPLTPYTRRTLGAVELVPGRVTAAVLTLAGTVLQRAEASYDAASAVPADIDAALARAAQVFAGHAPAGVGVAAAGLVDPGAGLIIEVNDVPALHGYPVTDRLRELIGVPVQVEHRARLQVLGDRLVRCRARPTHVRFGLDRGGARCGHPVRGRGAGPAGWP